MAHEHTKIYHRVRHHITHHVSLYKRSYAKLFAALGLSLTVLAIAFFITRGADPHVSELAFTEHSTLGQKAGSVIPASCESGYPHHRGECCIFPNTWTGSECVSPSPISGCTDPAAGNYNPSATVNNGSCTYSPCYPWGSYLAHGQSVPYYSASSVESPGTCSGGTFTCSNGTLIGYYPGMSAYQSCSVTTPTCSNGSAGPYPSCPVYGCTNPVAGNYNPSANISNGSCTCANGSTGSFPACPISIPGCTDYSASNYNPSATVNNGSCTYPPCANGSSGPYPSCPLSCTNPNGPYNNAWCQARGYNVSTDSCLGHCGCDPNHTWNGTSCVANQTCPNGSPYPYCDITSAPPSCGTQGNCVNSYFNGTTGVGQWQCQNPINNQEVQCPVTQSCLNGYTNYPTCGPTGICIPGVGPYPAGGPYNNAWCQQNGYGNYSTNDCLGYCGNNPTACTNGSPGPYPLCPLTPECPPGQYWDSGYGGCVVPPSGSSPMMSVSMTSDAVPGGASTISQHISYGGSLTALSFYGLTTKTTDNWPYNDNPFCRKYHHNIGDYWSSGYEGTWYGGATDIQNNAGPSGPYYADTMWQFSCWNHWGNSIPDGLVYLYVCPASTPTWNGSSCVISGPTPTATLTFNGLTTATNVDPRLPRTWAWGSTNGSVYTGSFTATGCLNTSLNGVSPVWEPWNQAYSSGTSANGSQTNTPVTRWGCHLTTTYTVTGSGQNVTATANVQYMSCPTGTAWNGSDCASICTGWDYWSGSTCVTPAPQTSSFIATPRTVKTGASTALSWDITYPTSSCTVTATTVCSGGHSSCSAAQLAAETTLNSTLSSGTTDANDKYGASRSITTALRTAAPSNNPSGTKALGKKSLPVNYTTDFTLSCGASTKKVRVLVTTDNEG